jgi:regulator of protease activity HflC (stomatin/prohibitin superfamily)
LDNVKVKVNLTLVFSVISARQFVYNLGASRFDELLHAAAEEAVRSLVRETTIGAVYELRGMAADHMLQDLNNKFKEFGVHFSTCTITNVEMPTELSTSLENATTFESKIAEEAKKYDFEMSQLLNKGAKERREVDIQNEKLQKELLARKDRAKIEMDRTRIEAERLREVAVMKGQEAAQVQRIAVEADLKRSKIDTEKESLLAKQKAKSRFDAEKVAVDQQAKGMIIRAGAALEKGKNASLSKKAEADTEEKAGVMLQEKRQHELEMLRLTVMERLGRKGHIMVGGDSGEEIMQAVLGSAAFESVGNKAE